MKIGLTCWLVFLQFLRRDFVVRKNNLWNNIINFTLLYPIIFCLQSAYFQANTYFGATNTLQKSTLLFAGNIVLVLLVVTYREHVELLFDFENKRFIDYQITTLNPFLLICERIFFTSLFTFFLIVPFYPVSYYLFPNYVDLSNTSWVKLFIILFLSSCCLSAYHFLAICLLANSSHLSSLWTRINNLLLSFGGFWIPWNIIYQYSPLFAYCVYFNPCIYITEGVKGAISGNAQFLPFITCAWMLLVFFFFFIIAGWITFKRRTDCL